MKFQIFHLLLLFTIITYASPKDAESLVANRSDGSPITYYLFEESKENRDKVLLLILQGSDCNSVMQIESIFSDYRNVWPSADLLLIEKYGISQSLSFNANPERKDCPAVYLANDNPEQRVNDIALVLDSVRKNQKYEKLIVIGGSEGAVIANLFAAKNWVDATISFNGGGRWFIDDVLHNISSEYKDQKVKNESIEGFRGFSEHVLNSEPFALEVSGHGYHWWHQMLSIDQLNLLDKVNTPLLIVQGGIDVAVSPKKVDEMVLALQESGKDNIKYHTYENLDHGFKNSNGQSALKKVITDMNIWLKSTLGNTPNNSMQPTMNVTADEALCVKNSVKENSYGN